VTFEEAFQRLIVHEGGFQDNPHDCGNWTSGVCGQGSLKGTNHGISAASYPDLDIKNLTLTDIRKIYYDDYWDAMDLQRIPELLHFLMFDAAVHSGVFKSVQFLQRALQVADDGIVGPITLKAANEMQSEKLAARFNGTRLEFMTKLSAWDDFGRGWARRIAKNLMASAG
jgi:lysozyme family protein